jgi:hypothetical protein
MLKFYSNVKKINFCFNDIANKNSFGKILFEINGKGFCEKVIIIF